MQYTQKQGDAHALSRMKTRYVFDYISCFLSYDYIIFAALLQLLFIIYDLFTLKLSFGYERHTVFCP